MAKKVVDDCSGCSFLSTEITKQLDGFQVISSLAPNLSPTILIRNVEELLGKINDMEEEPSTTKINCNDQQENIKRGRRPEGSLGSRGQENLTPTNIPQLKRGRDRPKKEDKLNLIVTNPFPDFDLKSCVSVYVSMKRLKLPKSKFPPLSNSEVKVEIQLTQVKLLEPEPEPIPKIELKFLPMEEKDCEIPPSPLPSTVTVTMTSGQIGMWGNSNVKGENNSNPKMVLVESSEHDLNKLPATPTPTPTVYDLTPYPLEEMKSDNFTFIIQNENFNFEGQSHAQAVQAIVINHGDPNEALNSKLHVLPLLPSPSSQPNFKLVEIQETPAMPWNEMGDLYELQPLQLHQEFLNCYPDLDDGMGSEVNEIENIEVVMEDEEDDLAPPLLSFEHKIVTFHENVQKIIEEEEPEEEEEPISVPVPVVKKRIRKIAPPPPPSKGSKVPKLAGRKKRKEKGLAKKIGDGRFQCSKCERSFKNKNVLYNHRSIYHRTDSLKS